MIVRPKIRYNIKGRTIIAIMIIVIAIVIAVANFGPYFGVVIGDRNYDLESNKIELVTKESDIYGMYDEDFYIFSNNSITVYNSNCEVIWSHMFTEGFTPSITTKGNYMLVTNDSTGTIYLFENRKEILNKKIDGKIKNTFLDKYGNMAIEYTVDSNHTDLISVFNKNGDEKLNFYHNNIISMEMLSDANKIVLKEFNSAQMLFIALNSKYYSYLERDIENNSYKIENVNYEGNLISETSLDSVPKSMTSSDYINYYIYQDKVYIQNKWGVELKDRDIGFTPKQTIVFNNCKSIALIFTNKIYILNI